MSEVLVMSKDDRRHNIRTDLEWKRSYLSEFERKNQRQKAAVMDTEAELTRLQEELAKLEREFDRHQETQTRPHGDPR